ncbi:MAG: hypothetical protein AB1760_00175 [Pseudomonadota bacterium]
MPEFPLTPDFFSIAPKPRPVPKSVLGELISAGFALAFLGVGWAYFDPDGWTLFTSRLAPLKYPAAVATGWYVASRLTGHGGRQTKLDLCAMRYVRGANRSGKTTFAMHLLHEHLDRANVWVTTHGARDVLDTLPPDVTERVIVLSPASPRTITLNLFQSHGGGQMERHLLADLTVRLFKRLYSTSFRENMEELVYSGTSALLEYAERARETVTLLDLYRFLMDDGYQETVLSHVASRLVRDTFLDPEKRSVLATLRRLRRPLSSDLVLRTLADPDGFDLARVDAETLILVCDLDKGIIGPEAAEMIAEVVTTTLQALTMRRKKDAPLVLVYLDEFQGYCNDALKEWIEEGGKRQVCVTLIHHRRGQLTEGVKQAVELCGTQYLFRQVPEDCRNAAQLVGRYEPQDYAVMPSFCYIARELVHGGFRVVKRRGPSPLPSTGQAEAIMARQPAIKARAEGRTAARRDGKI